MPFPLVAALVGAGLGAGKYGLDAAKEARQRKVASATTRWSPWTGMQSPAVQTADPLGSLLQGASMGALFGKTFGGGATPQNPAVGGIEAMKQGVVTQGAGNPLAPTTGANVQIGGWNMPTSPWGGMSKPLYGIDPRQYV